MGSPWLASGRWKFWNNWRYWNCTANCKSLRLWNTLISRNVDLSGSLQGVMTDWKWKAVYAHCHMCQDSDGYLSSSTTFLLLPSSPYTVLPLGHREIKKSRVLLWSPALHSAERSWHELPSGSFIGVIFDFHLLKSFHWNSRLVRDFEEGKPVVYKAVHVC